MRHLPDQNPTLTGQPCLRISHHSQLECRSHAELYRDRDRRHRLRQHFSHMERNLRLVVKHDGQSCYLHRTRAGGELHCHRN